MAKSKSINITGTARLAAIATLLCGAAAQAPPTLFAAGDAMTTVYHGGEAFTWGEVASALGISPEEDSFFGTYVGDEPRDMAANVPVLRFGELELNVTALASGFYFTCALDATQPASSAVVCWGYCRYGTCGHGDAESHKQLSASTPFTDLSSGDDAQPETVVSIEAGEYFACALMSTGLVKCWGADDGYGELGTGSNATVVRGNSTGQMGAALPYVDLGEGVTVEKLAIGDWHTCAVLDGGLDIKCWGWNGGGQLGTGDFTTRGDAIGQMGDALPAFRLGGRVIDIAAGYEHTCALLEDGTVKCWGSNRYGQLSLASSVDYMPAANETLPAVQTGGTVVQLVVGSEHNCVLLASGAVKCWGSNHWAQLGLPVIPNSLGSAPADLADVDVGPGRVAGIGAGAYHTCVWLVEDALTVRCWGANDFAQIGHGNDSTDYGDAPGEMGADLPSVALSPTAAPTAAPTTTSAPSTSTTGAAGASAAPSTASGDSTPAPTTLAKSNGTQPQPAPGLDNEDDEGAAAEGLSTAALAGIGAGAGCVALAAIGVVVRTVRGSRTRPEDAVQMQSSPESIVAPPDFPLN